MPGYMEMAENESGRNWVETIRDMEIKGYITCLSCWRKNTCGEEKENTVYSRSYGRRRFYLYS